jgi:hypothetical protein
MRLIHPALGRAFFAAAVLAASCVAQQPGTDQRRAGGERTVTGCLQRSGSSFVLKTDEGPYELNTDRDLSAFVGKQVKISGRWEATGTVTTAPVGNAPSPTAPAPSGEPGAPTPAFVGDLHLHITGTVIGDCAAPK